MKTLDLPPAVARAFVRDMLEFFAESELIKQDEIAARQRQALNEFRRQRDKPLRLSDVKAMFLAMRDDL